MAHHEGGQSQSQSQPAAMATRRSVRARRLAVEPPDEDSGSDSLPCPVFQAQPAPSAQQTLLLVQQQLAHLAMLSQRQLEALERLQARWEAEAEEEEEEVDTEEEDDDACDAASAEPAACGRLTVALVAAAAWAAAMAWVVAGLPAPA
jgi:hypothetical protein